MTSGSAQQQTLLRWTQPLFAPVRVGVMVMAAFAGLGVLTMMTVTCADVVMRLLGSSLIGAVDLVTLSGAVAVAGALPYTTAVKGHVAIEYFFHKLHRRGRIIVDSLSRLFLIGVFALVARACVIHGRKLYASGEVTMTIKIPIFWVPYVIALSSAMVALVIAWHLLHPGKKMLRP